MITVVIPYTGNTIGLVSLLTALQPQLHPDDDIYIMDSSPDRSGVALATIYGTTRSYIFVELGKTEHSQAQSEIAGFESMIQNKQKGCLILSEYIIISQTFISNLKRAIKISNDKYDVLIPLMTKMPYPRMDPNFKWFNPPTDTVEEWKQGLIDFNCYYVNEHGVKEFLANSSNKPLVGIFKNETAVLMPYKISHSPS